MRRVSGRRERVLCERDRAGPNWPFFRVALEFTGVPVRPERAVTAYFLVCQLRCISNSSTRTRRCDLLISNRQPVSERPSSRSSLHGLIDRHENPTFGRKLNLPRRKPGALLTGTPGKMYLLAIWPQRRKRQFPTRNGSIPLHFPHNLIRIGISIAPMDDRRCAESARADVVPTMQHAPNHVSHKMRRYVLFAVSMPLGVGYIPLRSSLLHP